MLDDLKMIHNRDKKDALGLAGKQWQQYGYDFAFKASFEYPIYDVVVAGMGGSGLAAKVLKIWPGLSVPLTVMQDYELPAHITKNTLLICSSYSGNTEEEVNVLKQATHELMDINLRPQVVVVASGGLLLDAAKRDSIPYIALPSGLQPRMTFGYQLRALVEILQQTPLLNAAQEQLVPAGDWLKGITEDWGPTVPTASNYAKQLALDIAGKSAVIYAGTLLGPAAYKWKISINENAKNIAWWDVLPEFDHNEFLGWTSHPIEKPYAVIELRSNLENPRVQKRFEIGERLLSGMRPSPLVIEVNGDTVLKQLIWAIALGDFVSIYLALLNGVDPTPVDLLEKFKAAMNE